VSKEWREKADTEINTQQLFKSPADYKGKIVIIGGVIIKSTNTKEGTYIEVVQMPLDSTGKPEKRESLTADSLFCMKGIWIPLFIQGEGK
jgi:outer membrane lipoprotein